MIKTKQLVLSGFDCDIYRLSSDFIYKHYAPYKLGHALYGRKNPTQFLLSIESENVERVVDYDSEGFVTPFCPQTVGNFLFYNIHSIKHKKAWNSIQNILQKVRHNDINPENILISRKGDIVLSDWSQHNEEPYYSFLDDASTMNNWLKVLMTKRKQWFPIINYKMIQIYCLKFGLNIVFEKGELSPERLALLTKKHVDKIELLKIVDFNGKISLDIYYHLFASYLEKTKEILQENLQQIKKRLEL